jgi:hypothetical protein
MRLPKGSSSSRRSFSVSRPSPAAAGAKMLEFSRFEIADRF